MYDLFAWGIIQTGQLEAIFWGGIGKKHGETSKLVFNLTSLPLFGSREETDGTVHPRDVCASFNF